MRDFYTEQQLIDAVKAGDEDRVRAIASLSPELIDTEEDGVPVVRLAVYFRHPRIAQELADMGARLDIFTAAAMDKADRLAILLQGARGQIDGWSADGYTPLALAARFGALHSARLLLAVGADPNARDANGHTPLDLAADGGGDAITRLLVARGANPSIG